MAVDDWDIVVVSYNSEADLNRYWSTLDDDLLRRVVQVDNSSSDGSLAVLSDRPSLALSSANLGLAHSNNIGARRGAAPYILFANPDVQMKAEDLDLFEKMLSDEHIGIVAPRLIEPDGTPQENARGWPTLRRQLQNRSDRFKGGRAYLWPVEATETAAVPWVLGAALAMRRSDFERLGGWPEEFFLYFEDTELCMRVWGENLAVYILGQVQWVHRWKRESRRRAAAVRLHAHSALKFYGKRSELLWRVPRRLKALYRHSAAH